MSVQLARRLFTVHEYDQMGRAGILSEDDRVELLEGEIVQMTPIGSRHADCVDRLNLHFVERLNRRAIVRVRNPIRLGEQSEPQPDLALLNPQYSYAAAHPGPQHILLIVEVADTSVETDRDIKIPLYARFAIPEVWLVDLPGNGVEVYRTPTRFAYQDVQRRGAGQVLAPAAFPDLELFVDDILGV